MFKKIKLFYLVMILLNIGIIGLFSITSVSAKEIAPLKFVPQITIPGSNFKAGVTTTLTESDTSYIAQYIKAIYNYALSIVGILATIVLMIGGYVWAMSGGDATKITQAKEMITGAIIGLLILLGSVTLLGKLNPALVNFKVTNVKNLAKVKNNNSGCCRCIVGGTWRQLSIGYTSCSIASSPTTCGEYCNKAYSTATKSLAGLSYYFVPDYKCGTNDACIPGGKFDVRNYESKD